MKSVRSSNFELLRIFSMMLILVHHQICHGVPSSSSIVFFATDSFAIIGVDLFILISGYFGIRLTWKSFLNLVFICMFYKVVHLCVDTFILGIHHQLYEWGLKPIFVVSRSGGWFVQVYFMLMFISPLLNKALDNLSEKEWKLSLFLLSFISFYLGWALHNYSDGAGYTLMNFVYIYVVGAAIRHYELLSKLEIKWIYVMLLIGIGGTFIGLIINKVRILPISFTAYNSPFVVLTAGAMFCIFCKMRIQKRWINRIAMSVLPVYLLTDGGNLSKLFYQWAGEIANTYSSLDAIGIFVMAAAVLIMFIALFDQIRLLLWSYIVNMFPKYLK